MSSTGKDMLPRIVGILAGIAIILGGKMCVAWTRPPSAKAQASLTGLAQIMDAASNKRAGITVQHWGTVTKLTADGSTSDHLQKFVVMLENGHMVLFAHDTGVAPAVPMAAGEKIEFKGRYDWNSLGGLIYKTNHDPQMAIDDGWIKHNGKVYR